VPAWLTEAERAALREFLERQPKVQRTGRYRYRLDDREVDFAKFIELPPLPGAFQKVLGALLGGLANIPFFIKTFDQISRRSLKKSIEADPV
jgi:hypothetical protein